MFLYNTLSRKIEKFKPIHPRKVSVYVCGITPYDTTHLGHAFTYISFDTLIRYLKFKGFEVGYTQNVTDINDRDTDILERARQQKISWQELASFWTNQFLQDMKALNWIYPTYYLKASEQISSMTYLIQKLLDKGLAYKVNNSVYLDISKKEDFGKLSRFNQSQMVKIAKEFEEDLDNSDKRQSLDITLWCGSSLNQPEYIPSFPSPFGYGRPGWHIECSAMSISSLGEQIDIHGGGSDLIFPHHESEVVQSEGATGKIPFAKYWVHSAQVSYQGTKMSKSKGNLVIVSDLLKKYSSNAIRWLLLSNHYRKEWEFKEQDLREAQKNVDKINSFLERKTVGKDSYSIIQEFVEIMDNDLNTQKALEFLLQLTNKNLTPDLQKLYTILGFKLSHS